jgi:NADPH:quinone reductase-like Zn-dependent oxidoreductase
VVNQLPLTSACELAKAGGVQVTGVCSTQNVKLVRSFGADEVIDFTREDFTTGEARFYLIFQLEGTTADIVAPSGPEA